MDSDKVVSLADAKARAAGVSVELASVIEKLNQRFGINIDIADERLDRFKSLYPVLEEAAKQHHQFDNTSQNPAQQQAFRQGIDVGKAQMMIDIIVCLLEQDGVLFRR
jgi:hypothetical protein